MNEEQRSFGMKLSRGSTGLEANYAMGPGRNLKSRDVSLLFKETSRISIRPPPKRAGRTIGKREDEASGTGKGVVFFQAREKVCPIKRDPVFTARFSYRPRIDDRG